MQELTPEGRRALDDIARRHGVSADAALTLLRAVAAGGGTMAQFSHPDLGGMGQWTAGGMVMVGDMFNHGLKQRVETLCSEMAAHAARRAGVHRAAACRGPRRRAMVAGGLGTPASSGAQNDMRYAYFPASRRLAIQQGGEVRLYDTGDHQISGVSQQQGGVQALVFTSQHGPVLWPICRRVDVAGSPAPAPRDASAPDRPEQARPPVASRVRRRPPHRRRRPARAHRAAGRTASARHSVG